MKFHMLLTEEIPPVPKNIRIISFGNTNIITDSNPPKTIFGDHILVEGSIKAVRSWLSSLDGFWLGNGPIQLEEFQIAHIKEF